ncbi:MAG TPA: hypothetical protein VI933_03425 [archaeon]|nr:hypothetical protein [archaeon]
MGIYCKLKTHKGESKKLREEKSINWSYTGFGDFRSRLEQLDADWESWGAILKAVDGTITLSKEDVRKILDSCNKALDNLSKEKYSKKFTPNILEMLNGDLLAYQEFFNTAFEKDLEVECD